MGNIDIRTITIWLNISSEIIGEIKNVTVALVDCLYIHIKNIIIVAVACRADIRTLIIRDESNVPYEQNNCVY